MAGSHSSDVANLYSLFSDVVRFGQNGEWQKALKTTNKILQAAPNDVKAFHCKVVCMIQLSQFQDVLTVCKKNEKLASELQFERAYCLYRLNQCQEALELLDSVRDAGSKVKELRAQVLYRLESFEECYEVYKDLIKNTQDDYDDERDTNFSAVVANLHATKSPLAKEAVETREDTYELTYNSSCTLIAKGEYEAAISKLMKAEDLCKKTLAEDDVTESELDDELGIIRVQRGYGLQMLKRNEEAGRLYAQVLKQKPSDLSLAAVASNNVVAINKDQNLFDSKKKIKVATANGLEHKLTNKQLETISLNQCLLLMHSSQGEQCLTQLNSLRKQLPDSADVVLIEAALCCREKNVDKAVDILQEFASTHPKESVKILFTLVQLLLIQGKVKEACSVLHSIGDVSYKPGVVSALVCLYLSIEDKGSAAKVFEDTVQWYKKNDPKSEHLVVLWRESANFHINNGNAVAAARNLEELHKINPKDVKVLAQLITAYSQFDADKALIASKKLPSMTEVVAQSVDVDTLESTAWAMGAKYLKKAVVPKTVASPGSSKSSRDADQLIKKRKRTKKKGKLPKNYDPNVVPDPERWLPRKERSAFKKRKDRRAVVSVGKGTQGATTGSAEIDMGIKSNLSSPRPNSTASPVASSSLGANALPNRPRQQPRNLAHKKKGGNKGKR